RNPDESIRNPGNQERNDLFLVSWIPYRTVGPFRAFALSRFSARRGSRPVLRQEMQGPSDEEGGGEGPVMKITAVDPFYLKMPEVTDAADGTQDTLLVRIRTDAGLEGWGECDASPLVTLAAYCCPMSHGNIINVRTSLMGETLDGPDDVRRLYRKMLRQGLDI